MKISLVNLFFQLKHLFILVIILGRNPFSSINNLKRDLTVGFEFLKDKRDGLEKVEFEKLSFKKSSNFCFN